MLLAPVIFVDYYRADYPSVATKGDTEYYLVFLRELYQRSQRTEVRQDKECVNYVIGIWNFYLSQVVGHHCRDSYRKCGYGGQNEIFQKFRGGRGVI